jgi:hypothetical protein
VNGFLTVESFNFDMLSSDEQATSRAPGGSAAAQAADPDGSGEAPRRWRSVAALATG